MYKASQCIANGVIQDCIAILLPFFKKIIFYMYELMFIRADGMLPEILAKMSALISNECLYLLVTCSVHVPFEI